MDQVDKNREQERNEEEEEDEAEQVAKTAKTKRAPRQERAFEEVDRWDRADSSDEDIMAFIRQHLNALNQSAGIVGTLPSSHKDLSSTMCVIHWEQTSEILVTDKS